MLMEYYVGEQLRQDWETDWESRDRRGEFVTAEREPKQSWMEKLRAYKARFGSSYTPWR
ncbi:hypothetical protein RB620_29930 [Paenibacillus sp. LHD-117]|uniref:hypothetical protein n=1 Tax=Paenibacillus sp. LHD-117 TaxID=3071412 RepID=UPI0027E08CF5|nr:hypothetical protein [Paenibacillus sp. LHD-117]MDQ6423635.1 hypothetical protein [Paenibacillus sp. LHD-117]